MIYFLAILCTISMISHGLMVYYGLKFYRFIGYIKYWSFAWKFFLVAQVLIFIRRGVGFYTLLTKACEPDYHLHLMVGSSFPYFDLVIYEVLLTIVVSVLLLLFVKFIYKLFKKYLHTNGDAVLMERETVIEHREGTVLKREDVVGKREAEVQEREARQKQSPYYKSKESALIKIL